MVADSTVIAVAFAAPGDSTDRDWPFAAGISSPASTVLTLWGTGGAVTDVASGTTTPLAADDVAVSTQRNEIGAEIPLDLLPSGRRWILRAATGLWDPAAKTWMALAAGRRDATTPGGAAVTGTPPRAFNVAFRPNESSMAPSPRYASPNATQRGAWFEDAQAQALAAGNIDAFAQELVLDKLVDRVDEVPGIPRGRLVEVVVRSSVTAGSGEGVSESGVPGRGAGAVQATSYNFLGTDQPYALYVPFSARFPAPAALVLHGGTANHTSIVNEFGFQQDIGERGGTILISPLARGPAGMYTDPAEQDVLNALEDAERRLDIDRDRISVSGYSMGGFGAYRMLGLHPDLFAAAVIWSGNSGDAGQANGYPVELLDNAVNVPTYLLHTVGDELVRYTYAKAAADALTALGTEFQFDTHPLGEHLSFALRDSWDRERAWLQGRRRAAAPRHVTWKYAVGWEMPSATPRPGHGGAYWVEQLSPRSTGNDDAAKLTSYGVVKATSLALPGSDDPAPPTTTSTGVGPTGPYVRIARGAADGRASLSNGLRLVLTNTASVTIDLAGAGIDPSAPIALDITSDGACTVVLDAGGSTRTVTVAAGRATITEPAFAPGRPARRNRR